MKDSKLKRRLVSMYEYCYEKRRVFILRTKYHLPIMTPDQTLDYIERHHCCIARYGDGEFDLITNSRDLHFQKRDQALSLQLTTILSKKNKKLLICVPRCMNTNKGCNNHSSAFWIEWGRHGHHEQIINLIRSHTGKCYRFGDSQITRPYIDWKTSERAKRTFPKLRHLWENKDIIIVEGDRTCMGVGNNLFDNAKSVKRILAPAVGAFEYREQIKNSILKHFKGELILMALGPTATVLAADFADLNIQALDIGNVDIEYEWFLRKATERIPIPGKFTNEAKNGIGRIISECHDEKYLQQIIDRVGC